MYQIIEQALNNKLDISYKNKIFITYINIYGPIRRTGYQVHYDHKIHPYSKIHKSKHNAIEDFLRIKNGESN